MYDYTKIPPLTMAGITRYVQNGYPGGHFLQAVFKNDLTGAMSQADKENVDALYHIVGYMYNKTPHLCWGDEEKVEDWMALKNPEGGTCATCANPERGSGMLHAAPHGVEPVCEGWRPGNKVCEHFKSREEVAHASG